VTLRRLVRLLGVVAILGGASLVGPTASHAATIESGWWWKANTGTSPEVPAVPVVPAPQVTLPVAPPAPPVPPNAEGGLQVAALQDGAFAVAAVRVDAELTSITLRVAPNGDANGMNAKLVACTAVTPWTPVAGGEWDTKPVVACDLINGGGSVAGIRSQDGSSWTFPVAPLADDGKTDVVIVPLSTSDVAAGVATPFQLVFVPPTSNDLVIDTSATPATDESATPDDSADTTGDFGADYSSFDPTFAAGSGTSSPVVSPALGQTDQAPVLPRYAAATKPDNGSQILGAVVVVFGLALLYGASRQTTPPIHPLVGGSVGREIPVAELQPGGLGRFVRPRSGKPPSLQ
jgi:hypothetical protein